MVRPLAAMPLVLTVVALVVRPSHADVVVLPMERVACRDHEPGDPCDLRRQAGTCVAEIRRRSSAGGLWDIDSRNLVCVPNRRVTPPMRACIGQPEHGPCALRGRQGRCELEGTFLQCRVGEEP